MSFGSYDTLRLIPPLTITAAELSKGMGIFCEALQAAISTDIVILNTG